VNPLFIQWPRGCRGWGEAPPAKRATARGYRKQQGGSAIIRGDVTRLNGQPLSSEEVAEGSKFNLMDEIDGFRACWGQKKREHTLKPSILQGVGSGRIGRTASNMERYIHLKGEKTTGKGGRHLSSRKCGIATWLRVLLPLNY